MQPSAPNPGRRAVLLLLAALLAALAGCIHGPAFDDQARLGPFFEPRNFAGDRVLPASVRRVLLLPVQAGPVASPETAAMLDEIVRASLQQQMRFEVTSLTREEALRRFGASEFSSVATLPHGFLDRLRESYACDAVLFVDLTVYRPYRPQAVGFRAKLATVPETRLVWNFDEVFSADDPAVVNSIRRYYYREDNHAAPPVDLSATALQSPGRFAAYAADTMLRTLPPR